VSSCRQDGLLLKPDQPLSSVDKWYLSTTSGMNPSWELMSTQTTIESAWTWMYVVAVNLTEKMSLTPMDLHYPMQQPFVTQYIALAANGDQIDWTSMTTFDSQNPLILLPSHLPSFTYCLLAPGFANGIILFGESGKWSRISQQRIIGIIYDARSISVQVKGSSGELVTMDYGNTDSSHLTASCKISSTGEVTFVLYSENQPPATCLNSRVNVNSKAE